LSYGGNANYLLASFAAKSNVEVVNFGTGSGSEAARMVLNAYVLSTESLVQYEVSLNQQCHSKMK
jgi:tRNA A58 N-methylase Trm61